MNAQEARDLGQRVAKLVQVRQVAEACTLLGPVLTERTPFHLLDRIGAPIGLGPVPEVNAFVEQIVADKTMGGWVVVGTALRQQLGRDPAGAFERCHRYVALGDTWYATDILGERVPGPALVDDIEKALSLLAPWRGDDNRWVRRAVGVAAHFWAKRSRGRPESTPQAGTLLAFLEPMFEEWDVDAVKSVGWGLKTLGRHYSDLVTDWLARQVVVHKRRHRALMLRKALTYLSADQRARASGVKD